MEALSIWDAAKPDRCAQHQWEHIIKAFSYLEGCQISDECSIGPYARLRPGVDLSDGVKIGNFVEIKNSKVAEHAKINHLSYVGDARIGKNTNIGAGTVTCNYDGVSKHRTVIGEDVFIGSNTMLIAPVTVGNNSMTGSGSVITQDIPADDLAISRSKQKNNNNGAKNLEIFYFFSLRYTLFPHSTHIVEISFYLKILML